MSSSSKKLQGNKKTLLKTPTGILGVDEITGGGLPKGRLLVEVAGIGPQVRVVHEPAQVGLEVRDIDRVEPGQGHPEPHVGLGDGVTHEVPTVRQPV